MFHGPNGTRLWWKWNSLSRSQRRPVVGHYGNRSLRKVLTSLHHITSTDNFQIHTTERLRYNTRGTRKRTPYTQYPFQNMLRHPRGGYWLYMTVRNMRQFWPPFRSLENWYSLTPVCEKNMEMSYFDPLIRNNLAKCLVSIPLLGRL